MELAATEGEEKFLVENFLLSGTQILLKEKDLVIAQTCLGARDTVEPIVFPFTSILCDEFCQELEVARLVLYLFDNRQRTNVGARIRLRMFTRGLLFLDHARRLVNRFEETVASCTNALAHEASRLRR